MTPGMPHYYRVCIIKLFLLSFFDFCWNTICLNIFFRFNHNADVLSNFSEDDEEAFVPIKCWECGGDKGKCNDAEDLGVEKVCEKGTYTCVVARDDGTFNRRFYF